MVSQAAAGAAAIAAPTDVTVTSGSTVAVPGVSVSDGFAGNVRVVVKSTLGTIAVDQGSTSQITGYPLTGSTIGIEGSVAAVNAALASLSVTTTTPVPAVAQTGTITVTATRGGAAYNVENGHYYEIVTGSAVTWADAQTATASRAFNGLTGYLVTVTSQNEFDFLRAKVNSGGWLGASDASAPINAATGTTTYATDTTSEGHWYWVAGPEKGQPLTEQGLRSNTCTYAASLPAVVAGRSQFNAWIQASASGVTPVVLREPNDCGPGVTTRSSNFGMFSASTGLWSDGLASTTLASYVVEYGGLAGQAPIEQLTSTINLTSAINPGTVVDLTSTPGDRQATLTWTDPADGGAPITSRSIEIEQPTGVWTPVPAAGATITASAASLVGATRSVVVSGLTNAVPVSMRVTVRTSIGATSSDAVTVTSWPPPLTPRNLTAEPGGRELTLAWDAPTSNGDIPVTGYHIEVVGHPELTADVAGDSGSAVVDGLTNGTSYTLGVQARNVVGLGAVTTVSGTPRTVPDPPTGVRGDVGNHTAALTWTPPVDTGGSPITEYTETHDPTGGSCVVVGTSATCTGLSNGTSYTFTVIAHNSAGPSLTGGTNADPIIPRTLPGPPSGVTGIEDDRAATLSWIAPDDNGGDAVSSYSVTVAPADAGASCVGVGTSTTAQCTGLRNGIGYTFTVTAHNAAGASVTGGANLDPIIPRTVPDVPTSVTAVAGDTTLALSWAEPIFDGGSPITGYSVTTTPASEPGSCLVAGAANTVTCTGLTNGTPYTVTVVAQNIAGSSDPSIASDAATPRTVPGAPTVDTVTPDDSSVTVTWTPPSDNGGSAITGYAVTASAATTPPGSPVSCVTNGTTTTAVCEGLDNGTPYTVTVLALNVAGASLTGGSSPEVTPRTVPGAPSNVAGTEGEGSVALIWSVPTDDGGSQITSYTVQPSPANGSCQVSGVTALCSGLTNGTPYTFTVFAHNIAGESVTGGTSPAATPRTTPSAPTAVGAVAGDASVELSWAAPSDSGGSVINGYSVVTTPADGYCTVITVTRSASCTGLTNGRSYTFTVKAHNAAGDSLVGGDSAAVTPRSVPGSPTTVTGTPHDTTVDLTWSAPADNGGSVVTGYVVTTSPTSPAGSCVVVGAATSVTCRNLANGTAYTFNVIAQNIAGDSAPSAESDPITPRTIPGAPTVDTAAPGDGTITLGWTAPADDGGSAITGYVVAVTSITSPASGASTSTGTCDAPVADGVTGAITSICSGLTNGATYVFTVIAQNIVGDSATGGLSPASTPRTVPGAPLLKAPKPDNTAIRLAWTAPYDGGSPITGYTITVEPADGICVIDAPPLGTTATCTGLTNGTSYTFTVTAQNAAVGVARGALSAAIAPRTIPGAPDSVSGTAGDALIDLTWTPPVDDGGAPITQYSVTASSTSPTATAGSCPAVGSATAVRCTGLTNGAAYTVTVLAVNAAGYSATGTSSAVITPITVPGAPTSVVAVPGDTTLAVTWTPPATDGGSPITAYVVTTSPLGGPCVIGAGAASPTVTPTPTPTPTDTTALCTGMANGTRYTATVIAQNSIGDSKASIPSASVTPLTVPGTPTALAGVAGNGTIALTWKAPTDDGGSDITGYRVSASSAEPSAAVSTCPVSGTATTTTCTGLTNGTPYTLTVTAQNEAGDAAAGAVSDPITPFTVPGAIASITGTLTGTKVAIAWTPPLDVGGSPVIDYMVEYRKSASSSWTQVVATISPVSLDASLGDSVQARVSARNEAGLGPATSLSSPVDLPKPPVIPPIILDLKSAIGLKLGVAQFMITAAHLKPGTGIDAWAFSNQIKLLDEKIDAAGDYTATLAIPSGLESGEHTLLARGVNADGSKVEGRIGFKVDSDGVVSANGAGDPTREPVEGALNTFHALDNPVTLTVAAVATASLLSLAGGGGHSGGNEGGQQEGNVDGLEELEHRQQGEKTKHKRWRDRVRGMRIFSHHALEAITVYLVTFTHSRSPLASRIIADAAPMRAVLGGFSLLLPALGIALGVIAANDAGGQSLPPATWIVAAIVAVGCLDALAGVFATGIYALSVLIGGGVTGLGDIRYILGILLMGCAPGILATYIRNYRRPPPSTIAAWLERIADFVVAPLVAGWAMIKIVLMLSPMHELELPIMSDARLIGLVVVIAMIVRVTIDEVANRWFSERLARYSKTSNEEATKLHKTIALLIKGSLFAFVSVALVGNVWQLYAAAAMLTVPHLLGMFFGGIKNQPKLWQVIPSGLPKLMVELALGALVVIGIGQIFEPGVEMARWGFMLAVVPVFLIDVLKLFGRKAHPGDTRWYLRPKFKAPFYRVLALMVFAVTLELTVPHI